MAPKYSEAWQAAELLDEIAKKADPVDVLIHSIQRILGNVRLEAA